MHPGPGEWRQAGGHKNCGHVIDPHGSRGDLHPHAGQDAGQGLHREIIDVDVHHVRGGVKRQVPYVLDDHGTGNIAPGVTHQVFQQRELFAGKFNSPAGALHDSLHPVQLQVGNRQHRFRWDVAAAYQRPDSRGKLAEREWLGQVVVRPGIKALHPVFHARALGQDQDRQAGFLQTKLAQHRRNNIAK